MTIPKQLPRGVSVRCIDGGYRHRKSVWRVAWSKDPDVWDPARPASAPGFETLKQRHQAHVGQVFGAVARDAAIRVALRSIGLDC